MDEEKEEKLADDESSPQEETPDNEVEEAEIVVEETEPETVENNDLKEVEETELGENISEIQETNMNIETGTLTEFENPYLSENFSGYLYSVTDIILILILGVLLVQFVLGRRSL